MADGHGAEVVLLCRVGNRICALPLACVGETMRPLPTAPFAGAPEFVRGVAVIRGAPVPVLDMSRLLGAADAGPAGRYVTVRSGERTVALAVGSVEGVSSLHEFSTRELPPLLREASAATVAAMGSLDAELLLVLETARIVPDSMWSELDREGTSS